MAGIRERSNRSGGSRLVSNATFFIQSCPICGRKVQIRVEHLGKRCVCRHCQGQFVAMDPANAHGDCPDRAHALLRRANELLDSVARGRN